MKRTCIYDSMKLKCMEDAIHKNAFVIGAGVLENWSYTGTQSYNKRQNHAVTQKSVNKRKHGKFNIFR